MADSGIGQPSDPKAGAAASGSAVAGNPVLMGGSVTV